MKIRDKYIAIIFLIFILFMPAATIVKNLLPESENDSSEERDVLENNGALRNDDADMEAEEQEDTSSENIEEDGFKVFKDDLNSFTEGMFLRKDFIKINAGLTMLMTGNSYIGSTQLLLGKDNWLFYKREDDGQPIWDYMGINLM